MLNYYDNCMLVFHNIICHKNSYRSWIKSNILYALLFTQIIQVAAKTLGIPMDMIKVKPCHTTTTPNSTTTRASLTSEMNGLVSQ